MHPLILTCLAMLAFAANSVLCRLALGDKLIDPASYTTLLELYDRYAGH